MVSALLPIGCNSNKIDTPSVIVVGQDSKYDNTADIYEILDMVFSDSFGTDQKYYNYRLKVRNTTDKTISGYFYFNILDKDSVVLTDSFVKIPQLDAGQAGFADFQLTDGKGYKYEDIYELKFIKTQRLFIKTK